MGRLPAYPPSKGPAVTLLVPDLSEWQGAVDWHALTAAYPAAIIRVHNGTRADKTFSANRRNAHAAGIRALGLYAYLVADRDPVDQAAEFVHEVGHLQAGEWPIVDCEAGAGDQSARVRKWAAYVARALGAVQPWLYSGESFYRDHGLSHAGIPAIRTWIAAYRSTEPTTGHKLWQYTDHRTVPGVSGPVDCSEFHGTVQQLLAATRPAPTQGPTSSASHPFPTGLHPGGTNPSARPLQQALKRTGWMDKHVQESDNYGPITQHAVAGFNQKHGFSDKGTLYDPAIGPHGWALLMSLAYGGH
jgi:GH25 family lysozyme M1 (1,4-beta-N-acetylmuramidase)